MSENVGILMISDDGRSKFVNTTVKAGGTLDAITTQMAISCCYPEEFVDFLRVVTRKCSPKPSYESLLNMAIEDLDAHYYPNPPPYKMKDADFPEYGPILTIKYLVDYGIKIQIIIF